MVFTHSGIMDDPIRAIDFIFRFPLGQTRLYYYPSLAEKMEKS